MKKRYAVRVHERMRLKKECMDIAQQFIAEGRITGMSTLSLAQELYFHAWFSSTFGKYKGVNRSLDSLLLHADPADLEDGGDKWYRRCAYGIIWYLTKGR